MTRSGLTDRFSLFSRVKVSFHRKMPQFNLRLLSLVRAELSCSLFVILPGYTSVQVLITSGPASYSLPLMNLITWFPKRLLSADIKFNTITRNLIEALVILIPFV